MATAVPETVLQEIWAIRPVYNGMTNIELAKRYGTRVYHVSGDGWYLRDEEKLMPAWRTRPWLFPWVVVGLLLVLSMILPFV